MAENNVTGNENNSAAGESSSTTIVSQIGSLNTSTNEALVEGINHISSFIRVLKARILFMFSSLAGDQQRRSRRIAGNNTSVSDYKTNLEEYLRKVEQLELHTAVFNSAIHSIEMGEYLSKSKEAIVQIVTENVPTEDKQVLDNFVEIVETTNNIIQASVNLEECHKKIIKSKQGYVQKLEDHRVLREERRAIQNADETSDENNIVKLENMLQKKMDNLNIIRGIMQTILTSPFLSIDFAEHPKLMEISKKRRKRFTL